MRACARLRRRLDARRGSRLAELRQGARVRHRGDSNDREGPPCSMAVQQRCHTATPSRFLRNTPDLDSDTDDLGLRVVRDEEVVDSNPATSTGGPASSWRPRPVSSSARICSFGGRLPHPPSSTHTPAGRTAGPRSGHDRENRRCPTRRAAPERAAPTWKRTFGFHPLCSFIDHGPGGTGEAAVLALRTGNAGSNTAADHIAAGRLARQQVPAHLHNQPHERSRLGARCGSCSGPDQLE
jgi:hypothetical protein